MDKLKELLGEELFKQVSEKLGDNKFVFGEAEQFIPKSRFDEVNNEKKELKSLIGQRDSQISELQTKFKSNEDLSKELENYKSLNTKAEQEFQTKLQQVKFDYELQQALAKANVRNTKAAKALLELDKIKLEGDKLVGIEEQLKDLQEKEAYLFAQKEPVVPTQAGVKLTGGSGSADPVEDKLRKAIGLK
jgi:DNA repair exonuclease SbcCD ATPase subunit